MFEYFPTHYSWTLGLLMAAQLGGELSEIDEACRPLIEVAKRPNVREDKEAQALWVARWSALARKVEALATSVERLAGSTSSPARRKRRKVPSSGGAAAGG